MNDRVRLGISDGIAEVRLMRADKMNALDPAMFEAIASAGEQLKSDPDVRVVVVSGEGRAFCAGLDVERITAATRGESILPFADLTSAPMASPISHSTSFGSGVRLPARARRRPALRRAGYALRRYRDQMGSGAGYGRHRPDAESGP